MFDAALAAARAVAGPFQHQGPAAGTAETAARLPVQQAACLREDRRRQRRPARAGTAQVECQRRQIGQRVGRQGEPGAAGLAEAEEAGVAGAFAATGVAAREFRRVLVAEATHLAFDVDDQHARRRPERVQCRGVLAQVFGAIEPGMLEGVTPRGAAHTEKLLPQPQVLLAFGLRITNCAPCRLSR